MDSEKFRSEVKKVFPHGGTFSRLFDGSGQEKRIVAWAFFANGTEECVGYNEKDFPQGPWAYAGERGDGVISGFGPTLPEAISDFRAKTQVIQGAYH